MWVTSLNLDITKKVIHRTLSSLLYLKVTSFFPATVQRYYSLHCSSLSAWLSLFRCFLADWNLQLSCTAHWEATEGRSRGHYLAGYWGMMKHNMFFSNMGLIILHIHVETFRLITLAVTTQTWQSWHKIAQKNPRKSESETETV